MNQGQASRTAQYMALFRALESTKPPRSRLFYDPYAKLFLDRKLRTAAWLSRIAAFRNHVYHLVHQRAPGALPSGVARTKLIDDTLISAVYRKTGQVIILGAGFDTRAMRLDPVSKIPIIEIDHPATSRHKRAVLHNAKIGLPANVAYWEIDFNKDDLAALAERNNLDFNKETVVIWEGVTNYLTKDAIDKTFGFISRFKCGSSVIFTYVHADILTNPEKFEGGEKLLADLSAMGEQWTFGFLPEDVRGYLRRFGLRMIQDDGAATYRATYLPNLAEKGYEFYRVVYAIK